jgi:hypothetical protein
MPDFEDYVNAVAGVHTKDTEIDGKIIARNSQHGQTVR